jgi:hypothetical protein
MNAKPQLATRFVKAIGTRAEVAWHWENDLNDTCKYGHRASVVVAESEKLNDTSIGGSMSDYYNRHDLRPACCERCQMPMPEKYSLSMGWHRRYNTPSSRPEPGDLYFVEDHEPNGDCPYGWTNCDGKHLHAVLPNGGHWDIDSRASNCTKSNDTLHRCWVRHGDPERPLPVGPNGAMRDGVVHVDKNGNTCNAGAGSIIYGNWHGFCRNGYLVEC